MDEPDVDQLEHLLLYLKRWFNIISPSDYLRGAQSKRIDPYSLILTFDDGYLDLHDRLLPLLEKLKAPATVFVNTGAIGGKVLWFQKLFAAVVRTTLDALPASTWRPPLELATIQQRVKSIGQVASCQRRHPAESWNPMIDELCGALRWDGELGEERMMDWEQLERLAQSPWITVGGHTVSHPYLTQCRPDQMRRELVECADELRSKLGLRFLPFSYPNGGFDSTVASAVEECGYDCAFIMHPGLNTLRTPAYQLFRHSVRAEPASAAFDLSFRVPLASCR